MNESYKYFISYRTIVKNISDALYELLINSSSNEKIFKDTEEIKYGDNINDRIHEALLSTEYFLIIYGSHLNDNYSNSWVQKELSYANKSEIIKIIPIKLDEINKCKNTDLDKLAEQKGLYFNEIKTKEEFYKKISILLKDIDIKGQPLKEYSDRLYNEIKTHLKSIKKNIKPLATRLKPIEFFNRESIKEELTNTINNTCHNIIYAPTHYGKTWLLNEVAKELVKKHWVVYRLDILDEYDHQDSEEIYKKALRVNSKNQIINKIIKDFKKDQQGIAFLFDCKNSSFTNHKKVIDHFYDDFYKDGAQLSQLIAGNYKIIVTVPVFKQNAEPSCEFESNSRKFYLPEFTYDHISQALDNRYKNKDIEINTQVFAARVFLFSGGHPKCVERIVKCYEKEKVLPDLRKLKQWSSVRAQNLTNGINGVVSDFLNTTDLAFYRLINIHLLKEIADPQSYMRNYETLRKTLFYSSLEDDETNMILQPGMARRVYLIDMYLNPEEHKPIEFFNACDSAFNNYIKILDPKIYENPELKDGVLWLKEAWFSKLQKKISLAFYDKNHSDDFNISSEDIEKGISLIKEYGEKCSTVNHLIKKELESDWEFKLLTNFQPHSSMPMKDIYNPNNLKNLLSEINDRLR